MRAGLVIALADEATQESLREAYSALESAARDAPTARLPRLEEGEVPEEGEIPTPPPPQDLGLVDYFHKRGIGFGMARIKNQEERGLALAGIEFTNAANSIVLIVPSELRYGSARELLSGGAAFAAMSPTGTIYCIADAELSVEPCPAPDLPNK